MLTMGKESHGHHLKTGREGFSLVELLIILLLLMCIASIAYFFTHQVMMRKRCKWNLREIHTALELYEIDRGTLPRLAFFPDEPKAEVDSIVSVLRPYGAGPEIYVCPALPQYLRSLGLTYIWNVRLNGRKMQSPDAPTWMLTEMSALSDNVPKPHLGIYDIIYTDGAVRKSKTPPPGLSDL